MDESFIQQLASAVGLEVGTAVASANETLIDKLEELQKTTAKAGVGAAVAARGRKKQNSILTQLLNQLSVALPQGARAFRLGSLFNNIKTGTGVVGKFSIALVGTIGVLGALTEVLYQFGQQLGGLSLSQTFVEIGKILKTSISRLFQGEFINPLRAAQIKGTVGKEFGQLITSEEAADLQLITQRLGIGVSELINLERALQGTGIGVERAVSEFRKIGILSKVSSTELIKNADAVARAGNEFNRFIVEGIDNAKRLGLEFNKMEKTLTGFTTDFEGTVSQFAQLRAVIPGFGVEFNELFSTALYGTTEEYTDIIRKGLLDAGITSTGGMSRLAAQQLEMATGFTTDQINRILQNQDVGFDVAADLDNERNFILKAILGTTVSILSATLFGFASSRFRNLRNTAGVVAGGKRLAARGGMAGAGLGTFLGGSAIAGAFSDQGHETIGKGISILSAIGGGAMVGGAFGGPGAIIGALLGGAAGVGSALFNDFVFRPGQPPIAFSPDDTLVGVKNASGLGTDTRQLESKVDQLIMTMNEQLGVFRGGLYVEMRDMDKAIIRQQESTVRNF